MRIALDAMGSDHFPEPDVAGAVLAAQAYPGLEIILVGDEGRIKAELQKHPHQGLKLEILHTPEYVTMDDLPGQVGRAKPRSSIHLGTQLVKDGLAQGFVSAGNTGAALAISTLHTLKRIPKVKRPMLAAIAPLSLQHPRRLVMSDIGANTDCRPEWLLQFAFMSNSYAQHVLNIPSPKVGLLSNGEEEIKGNELTRQAYTLLKQSGLNFVGNVEAKDVLIQGSVDVLVFDGFAGNIFMKTVEATASGMGQLIRKEIKKKPLTMLGGLLARPAFERVRKLNDPFEIGGTLLLGVQGIVIIAHGRTNALGIKNSIRMAKEAAEVGLTAIIEKSIQESGASDGD